MSDMYNITVLRTWKTKSKILLRVGLEPTIMCVLEIRRTHCATSVDVNNIKNHTIFLLFYLAVGDVRQAQDQQLRPPPPPWRRRPEHRHRSLWSRDPLRSKPWRPAKSGPIEEQPTTWKVAGWCAIIDTDEARRHATTVDKLVGIRACCPGRHHSHKQ